MQIKVMECKDTSHKSIVQEEIHSTNQHISYINELIAELQCKTDITSVPNINQETIQSTCYKENIADLEQGLTFWRDKVKSIDIKLKTNLLERRNLKNEIDVFLNDLNELKLQVEKHCLTKSDDITNLDQVKIEQNIEHTNRHDISSEQHELKSQIAFEHEALKASTNKCQIDTTAGNVHVVEEYSPVIMENVHSKLKTKQPVQNCKEIQHMSCYTNNFENFEKLSMQNEVFSKNALNIDTQIITSDEISGGILHVPCDVATQTDFKWRKVKPVKHEQEIPVLPEIHRFNDTPTNKTYINIFWTRLRDMRCRKTCDSHDVPFLPKQICKPISSHIGNIYQTMAVNSDFPHHKSGKTKVNNFQISHKRLSKNRILYHDKDLNLSWPDASNIAFHNFHKDNSSITTINNHCLQNQGDLYETNIPKKYPEEIKQSGKCHKEHPFSICSTEHGGTWAQKQVHKIPEILSKSNHAPNAETVKPHKMKNTKEKLRNITCDTDTVRENKVSKENKSVLENPRTTPISVRIIRKLESNCYDSLRSVKQKLSPIKQKKIPTKYPISPKYRKPRSYCSAFGRKKKFALKQHF